MDSDEEAKAVKPGAVEMALGDAHPKKALALALGGLRIEVARASEGAVAVLYPFALQAPIGLRHDMPPLLRVQSAHLVW
jgi:hypothetical protein